MRFTPERCLNCGTPTRRDFVSTIPADIFQEKGSLLGTPFWLCSNECARQILQRDMPRRYHFDRKASSDPDLPDDHIEEFINEWNYQQLLATKKAASNLAERVAGEFEVYYEKLVVERDAKIDKLNALTEKTNAKIEALNEKRDAQLQKLQEKRDKEEAVRQQAEDEKAAFENLIAPQPIPERYRSEHTHVLGPSGAGKTVLLHNLILDDLWKDTPPGIILIDPKGFLVEKITRVHQNLRSLDIIDPLDQPALGMFAGQSETEVISIFSYIFAQADAGLSWKMAPVFTFCARLLLSLPEANLMTFLDLLESSPKDNQFADAVERLPDMATRRFFQRDFHTSGYGETRNSIKSRLYDIISRPQLFAMLNAPVCKLDMLRVLQERRTVLVHTGMASIGPTGSALLGRFMIALTLNAAFARSKLPKSQWHPAYLFIDEFQSFADEFKTPEMLRLAREFNLGIVMAHQYMNAAELTETMRNAISTNTTIKYCARPAPADKAYMARDLGCEPEFLDWQTPWPAGAEQPTHVRFACSVRGMTQHPMQTMFLTEPIEEEGALTDTEYRNLRTNIRNRLTHKAPVKEASKPSPPSAPSGDSSPPVPQNNPPRTPPRWG